jgi:hypothetical protein
MSSEIFDFKRLYRRRNTRYQKACARSEKEKPRPLPKTRRTTHGYIAFQWSQNTKRKKVADSENIPPDPSCPHLLAFLELDRSLFCSHPLLPGPQIHPYLRRTPVATRTKTLARPKEKFLRLCTVLPRNSEPFVIGRGDVTNILSQAFLLTTYESRIPTGGKLPRSTWWHTPSYGIL